MRVGLIYGGRSGEHEVSINSAKGVLPPLRNLGHTILLLAITLEGQWFLQKQDHIADTIDTTFALDIVPGRGLFCAGEPLLLDVAFAVTHGYGGEDGNLQGLCMLANLPLCGCNTLSSAIGMHKDVASRLFSLEGIPTVPSVLLLQGDLAWLEGGKSVTPSWISPETVQGTDRWSLALRALQERLGPSLFVKPENSGSSLGVSALPAPDGLLFQEAVLQAKCHSEAVLVQELIEGVSELECAVLDAGAEGLVAAGPALVVDPGKEREHFLSYDHKYGQIDSAYLQLPSSLPPEMDEQIRSYAKRAFRAIRGEGYARVDFFVSEGRIYLNEINTSPGMTGTSHFPLIMRHGGYTMERVLELLIAQALQKKREESTRTYRPPGA